MNTFNKVILQQEQNARDAKHEINDFDQHFASLEEKLDRVLQILTTLPKRDK